MYTKTLINFKFALYKRKFLRGFFVLLMAEYQVFEVLAESNLEVGLADIFYHILQPLIVIEYDEQLVQKRCKI